MLSALSIHNNPLHPDAEVAREADETFRKAIRLAEALGVPVVNTFSGLPAGAPGDTMPNWVTCPWPPHFLETLDYQWNKVALPYWREAAPFAADHGIKVAFEMHPGMLVYNVETLLRLREVNRCSAATSIRATRGGTASTRSGDPRAGQAIFHVHGKDVAVDRTTCALTASTTTSPTTALDRAWTFRSIGYGTMSRRGKTSSARADGRLRLRDSIGTRTQ